MEHRETCVLNGTKGNMCTKWNKGKHVYLMEHMETCVPNGTQGNMCTT